jgi:hypothetical protein
MKLHDRAILIFGLGAVAVGGFFAFPRAAKTPTMSPTFSAPTTPLKAFTLQVMDIVQTQGSLAKKNELANTVTRIADDVLTNFADKETWVTLLAIESKFKHESSSSAGARGIGQLMPKYFKAHGAFCGVTGLEDADIGDLQINLRVSACLFKTLLEKTNGSVMLALVAYNSGFYSGNQDKLKALTNIPTETANYVTKFFYIKEQTKTNSKPQ